MGKTTLVEFKDTEMFTYAISGERIIGSLLKNEKDHIVSITYTVYRLDPKCQIRASCIRVGKKWKFVSLEGEAKKLLDPQRIIDVASLWWRWIITNHKPASRVDCEDDLYFSNIIE